MSANVTSAKATIVGPARPIADELVVATNTGPWPVLAVHARAISIATVTCLVVLIAMELAVFRSGFFAANVAVTDPQWPAAKMAIAAHRADARILYVGDSTMMTSVVPAVVSRECPACGAGFNAGFSSANPWLTEAFTERLLAFMRPRVVVISVSPWTVDSASRFVPSDLARQTMTGEQLAARGASLDLTRTVDAAIGSLWSAYGQRAVLKEWFSSLMPGQRYDESLLGYYVAPGSIDSDARLRATAERLLAGVGAPSASAPGAQVIGRLVEDLRSRGIDVVFLVPPLHPAAGVEAPSFLTGADAAIAALAAEHRVPIIDCRGVASARDFRDVTHLLEPAATRHSTCVGERLRQIAGD